MAGMLNISEATAIGTHAVLMMLKDLDRPQRVPRMAEFLGVSAAHLHKVLQRLVHAGLVNSIRGPKGGYRLAKAPQQIRMGEVFQAIEGKLSLDACLLGRDHCCMGACALGDLLCKVNGEVERKLQTRLSDLGVRPQTGKSKNKQKSSRRV